MPCFAAVASSFIHSVHSNRPLIHPAGVRYVSTTAQITNSLTDAPQFNVATENYATLVKICTVCCTLVSLFCKKTDFITLIHLSFSWCFHIDNSQGISWFGAANQLRRISSFFYARYVWTHDSSPHEFFTTRITFDLLFSFGERVVWKLAEDI